jgi:hypothetical protein
MAARLEAPRAGARPVTGAAPARRAGLAWPRLPAAAELATIGAGYAGYALVRLAIHADRHAAFAHAAQLWQAERRMHLRIEPWLNRLAAARPPLAEAAGYYYGLLHFIITPLVLAWLYWRRPAAFGRLRSALVLATTAANVVFWAWPAAPPRLAVRGMTDILATRDILGAAAPHGATSLVNLYAAMPSLHVAWAAWCATAIVITTRSRWRHLAWLYPAATTLVVLASANHFVLDAAGGLAVAGLGMLAAGWPGRLAAGRRARPASPGHRHVPGTGAPARASSRRRPAAGRPAPGRTGRARRWRALAAGHRTRAAAAAARHTANKCPVRCSARARRPAPARPRLDRR